MKRYLFENGQELKIIKAENEELAWNLLADYLLSKGEDGNVAHWALRN